MFKIIRKIIKWGFRIAILLIFLFCLFYLYKFIIGGITSQAGKKCQEITAIDGNGKERVYAALADWIKTQSTSLVTVKKAYYKKDDSKGDQIIIEYSLYGNIYSGNKTINENELQKFCGKQ